MASARVGGGVSETVHARTWLCGSYTVSLEHPVLMGVLNVTPDSFSDGGVHDTPPEAIAAARSMHAGGALIIDVGGESTRPGSDEVAIDEELARVLPVVKALADEGIIVSVDTRHAVVAQACVGAGASIINDVSGFRDPAMVEVAKECDAGLVVMHMAGEPKAMQDAPRYEDVAAEVGAYLVRQADMLEHAGIAHDRIVIDPGPGFGKNTEHNLALLAATPRLAALGYPLMVATSRKRFTGEVTGVSVARDRVMGSVASACYALFNGATIARVHDVEATRQAISMIEAIVDALPSATVPPVSGRALRAFIALGSNQGDRVARLKEAACAVDSLPGTSVIAASRIYETEPAYSGGEQPAFANAVLAVKTELGPYELLDELNVLEAQAGRVRTFPNAPRTLDLDLLDVEDIVLDDPHLMLPHPAMTERAFVMTPLLECLGKLGIEQGFHLADGTVPDGDSVRFGAIVGTLGTLM